MPLYTTQPAAAVGGSGAVVVANMCARLSLATGDADPVSDIVGASTLYLVPLVGATLPLLEDDKWVEVDVSNEPTLAITGCTANKNYNVYAAKSGSNAVLSKGAEWTNDTTMSDTLDVVNGALVLASDHTKRLVGGFRATAATTTESSYLKRYVSDLCSPRPRRMRVSDSTDTWAGPGGTTWRQARGQTANKVEFFSVVKTWLEARSMVHARGTSNDYASAGIGIDSVTVNSADPGFGGTATNSDQGVFPTSAEFKGFVVAGYHYAAWLEASGAGITFYGDNGGIMSLAGLSATIWS